jgi:CheY-like chemotaxis protein
VSYGQRLRGAPDGLRAGQSSWRIYRAESHVIISDSQGIGRGDRKVFKHSNLEHPSKILIIDDDPVFAKVVKAAFSSYGYDAISASNGADAMKMVRTEQPDLVVTDIVMPEQDGIATILELKRCSAPPKVIAISGGGRTGRRDYLRWAKELGADEVLAKPFDMDALIPVTQRLLA